VLIERGRAVGVEYARRRRRLTARAAREVVLAAGAINSPQLLLLSGVGPGDELRARGVAVANDLPGVGKNLQDHLNVNIVRRAKRGSTLDGKTRGLAPIGVALEFLLYGTGPGTSNVAEAGAFATSELGAASPDIQYHFIPAQVVNHARTPMDGDGVTLHACCLRPQSRGEIRLASADPLVPPIMDPNYLAAEYDLKILLAGLRQGRDILAAQAFRPWLEEERLPGAAAQSNAALEDFVRATAETEYHLGFCRTPAERAGLSGHSSDLRRRRRSDVEARNSVSAGYQQNRGSIRASARRFRLPKWGNPTPTGCRSGEIATPAKDAPPTPARSPSSISATSPLANPPRPCPSQQRQQLGEVRRHASRYVLGQQLRRYTSLRLILEVEIVPKVQQ
jgi:choline dehydrogenase-like flavoprotein